MDGVLRDQPGKRRDVPGHAMLPARGRSDEVVVSSMSLRWAATHTSPHTYTHTPFPPVPPPPKWLAAVLIARARGFSLIRRATHER